MRAKQFLILCLTSSSAIACYSEKAQDDRAAKVVESSVIPKPQTDQRRDAQEGRVTSRDGTKIAFSTTGKGPAVIIVNGALSNRALVGADPLVAELSKYFTVYTYDRPGRGQSPDVQPYAVEREIEDLEALVDHTGNSASVYGVSSGAALSLQAAAKLGPTRISRLALYEPPYGQDSNAFAEQRRGIQDRIKTGAPGDAAEYFLTAIGTPRVAIQDMKRSGTWEAIKKIDFTLAYDFAVLGDGEVPQKVASAVRVPTLVMNGGNSMPFMQPTADQIAKLVPLVERRTLDGQSHQADGRIVAPLLIEFFTRPQHNG